LLAIAGVIIMAALPFIVNPLGYTFTKQPMSEFKKFELDTALLYKSPESISPEIDLTKGKHIACFASVTCPHCRMAAQKLGVMKKKNPGIPLVFVFYNNKEKLQRFYDETKTANIPHILVNSQEDFLKLTNATFPRIFWVNNSQVVYECNYYQLDQQEIERWLQGDTLGRVFQTF
jgi:hypothetical protein